MEFKKVSRVGSAVLGLVVSAGFLLEKPLLSPRYTDSCLLNPLSRRRRSYVSTLCS
ncbi:MAG: hypothetical protein A07HR60_01014 [uncultured archaeon A07HR60]|nr:MAG: hypothetical protein J07HR59_00406 [Halorubrum sp. J07HR59]ESS12076.1 MAG: hypothetical protein A07HR60_01014 [uncultured archaeon A07HR60]